MSSRRMLCRRLCGALPLVAAGLVAGPPAGASAQAGSISGTVVLEPPPPPRRTANRYPGGASRAETVQQVPAIVYVVGAVGGSAASASNGEMVQQDTAFAPAAVIVPVGGTVDFPNADPFFHNVFSYSSSRRFDLGRYPQGQAKSVTFDEPGIVSVFCEVHEKMRGVIVVAENRYHAVVAGDGSFRIDGIPPGEYQVVFWSADHEAIERAITVAPGQTAQVDVELNR